MQIRKKFMSLSIAFTMMLSTFVVGNNNSNLKINAEFEKNASEVVEDITFGWNLGNTLDSYSLSAKGSLATETSWVNPDAEAVQIVNELNQVFVDIVRNSGGNNDKRNLIVNTYCAGGNNSVTKDFVLPNDTIENHLIVEAHIYQPFYFTSEFYPEVTTWGKAELNNYIGNMYDTFVKNGTPVIIGKFGCAKW